MYNVGDVLIRTGTRDVYIVVDGSSNMFKVVKIKSVWSTILNDYEMRNTFKKFTDFTSKEQLSIYKRLIKQSTFLFDAIDYMQDTMAGQGIDYSK